MVKDLINPGIWFYTGVLCLVFTVVGFYSSYMKYPGAFNPDVLALTTIVCFGFCAVLTKLQIVDNKVDEIGFAVDEMDINENHTHVYTSAEDSEYVIH